jgi:hypothetical protein
VLFHVYAGANAENAVNEVDYRMDGRGIRRPAANYHADSAYHQTICESKTTNVAYSLQTSPASLQITGAWMAGIEIILRRPNEVIRIMQRSENGSRIVDR